MKQKEASVEEETSEEEASEQSDASDREEPIDLSSSPSESSPPADEEVSVAIGGQEAGEIDIPLLQPTGFTLPAPPARKNTHLVIFTLPVSPMGAGRMLRVAASLPGASPGWAPLATMTSQGAVTILASSTASVEILPAACSLTPPPGSAASGVAISVAGTGEPMATTEETTPGAPGVAQIDSWLGSVGLTLEVAEQPEQQEKSPSKGLADEEGPVVHTQQSEMARLGEDALAHPEASIAEAPETAIHEPQQIVGEPPQEETEPCTPPDDEENEEGDSTEGFVVEMSQPDPSDPLGTVQRYVQELEHMGRLMIRVGQVSRDLRIGRSPLVGQEVHRIRGFVQMGCEAEFMRIFGEGWPTGETPAMMRAWRGRPPRLVGRDVGVLESLYYIELAFRDVFILMKHQIFSTEVAVSRRVDAYRLLQRVKDESTATIKSIQNDLAEQSRLASERGARLEVLEPRVAALEDEAKQREAAWEQRVKTLEDQLAAKDVELAAKSAEAEKAKSQLMEAARMVKAAREREILADRQLRTRTEEVRRLRVEHSSTTPTSSVHPGTHSLPPTSQ